MICQMHYKLNRPRPQEGPDLRHFIKSENFYVHDPNTDYTVTLADTKKKNT